MNPQGRYFCESCEGRYDARGDCPRCPEEPLLDLLDEDVLLMLGNWDDDRRQKRLMWYTVACGVGLSPILIAGLVYTKLLLLAYIAATSSASVALIKAFPPHRKCPDMGQLH